MIRILKRAKGPRKERVIMAARKKVLGAQEIEAVAAELELEAKEMRHAARAMRESGLLAVSVDGWKALQGATRGGMADIRRFRTNLERELSLKKISLDNNGSA